MRVVVDTNVFIGFVARPTVEARCLRDWLFARATVLHAEETVAELVEVLGRRKFVKRTTGADIAALLATLDAKGERVPLTVPVRACCDPDDDMFLSLAISGKADCIITHDHDLLVLGIFSGARIMTPAQFLRKFGPP